MILSENNISSYFLVWVNYFYNVKNKDKFYS